MSTVAAAAPAIAAMSTLPASPEAAAPSAHNEACPRCAAPFHCGAADPRCDCFDLQLSQTLRQRLAVQYSRCLCLPCLRALHAAETNAQSSARLSAAE
ncbi:cysteine-rich CWC family protein [Roseateles sp. GG27B]